MLKAGTHAKELRAPSSRLANRLDSEEQAKVPGAVYARIPMVTEMNSAFCNVRSRPTKPSFGKLCRL